MAKFIPMEFTFVRRVNVFEMEMFMATSSITKNFVISGKRQVEMFADAVEASANDRPNRIPVAARQLKGKDDLMFLRMKREKANGSK